MANGPQAAMAVAAALILLGIGASKVSSRLGVPALLLFLALGMLSGSEGVGGIDFEDSRLAQDVGVVALAVILFSGGFDTAWAATRPVLPRGALLATVGVVLTAGIAGAAAAWILDVPLLTGLLLGAIISSTDAAAVFAVLRSRSVGLRDDLRPLLELESGSNDPMAVFLTLALLRLVTEPGTPLVELVPLFAAQMVVGGLVGYLLARLAVELLNRSRLEYDGLYSVLLIAVVIGVYGAAALLGGSGFLAVYVAGIVVGNARVVHRRSLARFADGLAWLMQIVMFLVLGLLVFPSQVVAVAGPALLVSAVLILVARPLGAGSLLLATGYGLRRSAMVSWVGLRGAAPIVLATFPLVQGAPHAQLLFNVVFFIVLTSVLIQGTTIPLAARRLGVDRPLADDGPALLDEVEQGDVETGLHELRVGDDAPAAGRALFELDVPAGVLVVLVRRGGELVVPQGSTRLLPGDRVLVAVDDATLDAATRLLTGGATADRSGAPRRTGHDGGDDEAAEEAP